VSAHLDPFAFDGMSPEDPTAGEMELEERRWLVARIADAVGATVSEKVQAAADASRPMSDVDERVAAATEIHQALRSENEARLRRGAEVLSEHAHTVVFDSVLAHIYGLGELDVLLHHPDVENIDCNGPDCVHVTFAGGHKVRWGSVADSIEAFNDLIRRVARRLGLVEVDFDARHARLDLQLPDGSRLFAIYGGPATNGTAVLPLLSIRRHRFMQPTSEDLVGWGVWPEEVGEFVCAAFAAGENVIVGGDWNSGKTTMLRALALASIARHERVVTVEASITELGLHHSDRLDDVAALFSRPPGAEGEGEVTVADQVEATRRLNPYRVIVGEILGGEVGPVLDVFSGSTRGSACTIHARSARAVLTRFEQYGLSARPALPPEAVRYALAESSPIVVHLAGDETEPGVLRRYCTSVLEVTGLEDGHVSATELWSRDADGEMLPRNPLSSARRERLARRGWDWATQGWAGRLPEGGTP
jgi:pilus assembly protein CpaF